MNFNKYLDTYITMISLRGLTEHTVKSYKTYISAYLDYVFDLLKKNPADVSWIDRRNMRIHITHGKNRSDRYALLSPNALKVLENYWFKCGKPRNYLFPQRYNNNKPNDPQAVERHFRETETKLGWDHRFTCHSLRHAFATHFYEDTHDLLTLKHLLGHKSINSTTIYVTLSDVTLKKYASPFDSLEVRHG